MDFVKYRNKYGTDEKVEQITNPHLWERKKLIYYEYKEIDKKVKNKEWI
jgi:hypothetical protein